MNTKNKFSILLIGLFVFLFTASSVRAEIAVKYRIDKKSFKKQTLAADMLTFSLYDDSGCTNLVYTQDISAGDTTIVYEKPKAQKVKGGEKPANELFIKTVLSTPELTGPLFLVVTGPGITPTGNICQVQVGTQPIRSNYFQSTSLNTTSANVTTSYTKIDDFLTFTKEHDETRVEVMLNSRARAGVFAGGASGVMFQVRIDNNAPDWDGEAAITTSNATDFVSIFAVFDGLPAGSHTLSVWARSGPSGTSNGVVLDPGGWGARIVVKETY